MSDYDPGLDAIVRTDRFVDALAGGARMSTVDPLSAMLGSWRDEVRGVPDAHVLTLEQAAAALAQAQKPVRRNRIRFAVVGAAAAAVLAAGGAVAIGYDSWFGQPPATRSDAVTLAAQELDQVQQLVNQGKWDEAQQKLVTLAPTVQSVDNTPEKQNLVEQYNSLTAKVIAQNPEAPPPPPGAPPPPVNPQSPLSFLPVPVIESPTSSAPSIDTNMMLSPGSPSSPSSVPTSPNVSVSVSSSPIPTSSPAAPPSSTASPSPTPIPTSPSPSPTPTTQSPLPTPTRPSPTPMPSSVTATPSPTPSTPSPPPVAKQTTTTPPPPPVTVTTPAVQATTPPAAQTPPPAAPPAAPAPEPEPHRPPANSKSAAPVPVPTTSVVPDEPKVR
ncbi:MAG TPA: anti-sigma-D factor RsdA [Mycobacterium sp.]|nr:anti-sigma-D factor RsdA [Mycobacterium sp.]